MNDDIMINLPTTPHIFENYNALCNYLGIPVLGGKSKQLQLKKLERYMKWTREGNKYIITETYSPHQSSGSSSSSSSGSNSSNNIPSSRGKNKPLTRYQYLFNTILLNQLIYGGTPDEDNRSCISFTKTELRQGLFKLVNRDYYNIRKDIKRASRETGLTEEMLKFADRKVTDKMNSMSFRGFRQLKEEGRIDVSEGLYVYYIDLQEYFNTGAKIIRNRCVSDTERTLIMSAGWIGEKEFENELEELEFEDKLNPDTYRGEKSKNILKHKLEILNGVEYLESVVGKLMNGGSEGDEELGEKGEGETIDPADPANPALAPISIEELIAMRLREALDTQGRKLVPLTEEQLEQLKHSEGLNAYALERGEFWVNIVEKTRFFVYTPHILELELIDRIGKLQSMPGAQLELNQFMLDWIEDKAKNVWGGFSQKFLNESKTGSRDIVKDMGTFAGRYVDIKRTDKNLEWREYKDERGKIWRVRYSNGKMKFDETNLKLGGPGGPGEGEDPGTGEGERENKQIILWNVPNPHQVCTSNEKLLEIAAREWGKRGWLPIDGYLGDIWDEDEGREIKCIILELEEGEILVLKGAWVDSGMWK